MLIHHKADGLPQGHELDRLNEITVYLFAVSRYLTHPILSSQGLTLRIEWFVPQRGKVKEGSAHLST